MKTAELSEVALDYAVAVCETENIYTPNPYSTDWAQGGPIIEREWINVTNIESVWIADIADATPDGYFTAKGRTPLEAAMRCYVASKLGNEVEIPAELLEAA